MPRIHPTKAETRNKKQIKTKQNNQDNNRDQLPRRKKPFAKIKGENQPKPSYKNFHMN